MNLLRHRRERLALRAENEFLRSCVNGWMKKADDLNERCGLLAQRSARLRAELDQAEAELRALRGEVA
jgi:hypothetical protein